MNLKISKKHEILEDLKRNYTSVGHPVAFSGIDIIYKYYKKQISKPDIEHFLSTKYTYTRQVCIPPISYFSILLS